MSLNNNPLVHDSASLSSQSTAPCSRFNFFLNDRISNARYMFVIETVHTKKNRINIHLGFKRRLNNRKYYSNGTSHHQLRFSIMYNCTICTSTRYIFVENIMPSLASQIVSHFEYAPPCDHIRLRLQVPNYSLNFLTYKKVNKKIKEQKNLKEKSLL